MLLLIKKESTVEWIYLLVNFDFRGSQTFVSKTYAGGVKDFFTIFPIHFSLSDMLHESSKLS